MSDDNISKLIEAAPGLMTACGGMLAAIIGAMASALAAYLSWRNGQKANAGHEMMRDMPKQVVREINGGMEKMANSAQAAAVKVEHAAAKAEEKIVVATQQAAEVVKQTATEAVAKIEESKKT